MKTEIIGAETPGAITRAVEVLRGGDVVALPTETVYGLAANALQVDAVLKIFEAKERPRFDPLIVHLPNRDWLVRLTSGYETALVSALLDRFWPGPLTFILPRTSLVPDVVTAGLETVAVRMSSHPIFREILRAFGGPLAAPSANRFGRVSPTTAEHVADEFGAELPVLDGGAARIGIESAIVDCSLGRPVLLRPGVLTRARIEEAAGEALQEADEASPRAPGTLAAHYAPEARLRVMSTEMLKSALRVLGAEPLKLAVYSRSIPSGVAPGVMHRRMPARAEQAAHELFRVLRELDREGAHLIWVEEPPPGPEWDGVRDRLGRAAAT